MSRIVARRACRQCGVYFDDIRPRVAPQGFCSVLCHEADVQPRGNPRPTTKLVTRQPMTGKRKAVSPASKEQREKVAERACVVCREPHCDPAHLIDRSLLSEGQDDPRAVIPLCRAHHDEYDRHELDLLPCLEPWWRAELAYAVERFGLRATYQRVTGGRLDGEERNVQR